MKIVAPLLMILLLAACGTGRMLHSSSNSYCAPAVAFQYSAGMLPLNEPDSLLQKDTLLAQRYSPHDILLANAAGVLPLLRRLQQVKGDSSLAGGMRYLELKQQVADRLMLAVTEIQSISAELDCEGERADQLGGYLDDQHNKRVRRLTVLSIVLGAATTVATALIRYDNAQKATGITGGVISAALGGVSAFPGSKKVSFLHGRNLLQPLWHGNDSAALYPPFIWYVLNNRQFSNDHQSSIGANIRNRWLTYEFDGKADSAREQLLFGKGGLYTADDLHTRANMLNQLQSTIRSINQDLQSFINTFRENTAK